MVTIESFAEHIWRKIGAEGREQVRQSWGIIGKLDPEIGLKVYACFLWATWLRGGARSTLPDGKRDFFDQV